VSALIDHAVIARDQQQVVALQRVECLVDDSIEFGEFVVDESVERAVRMTNVIETQVVHDQQTPIVQSSQLGVETNGNVQVDLKRTR
jgi:hypothetical protein